jgi:Flp pilus assembly protein TadG
MLVPRHRLLRLAADRKGAIAIMMALAAVVLLGFVGLGVDVGMWETAKRDMQGAADQAAFSAAIAADNGGSWQVNARGVTAQMGFAGGTDKSLVTGSWSHNSFSGTTNCWPNATSRVTVCANNPPPYPDRYYSNSTALEVTVTQPQQTFLSRVFLTNVTASARAVALEKIQGGFCILVLKDVNNALTVAGNTDIETVNCNIQDNSTQPQAANWSGGATINTKYVSIVGGYNSNGNTTLCGGVNLNCILSPSKSIADPFAPNGINPVTYSTADYSSFLCNGTTAYTNSINGTVTLDPSLHGGTLVFCGSGNNNLTINGRAVVTMMPGIYVFDKGTFNIAGGAQVTGTGVHIFLTSNTTTCGKSGNWAIMTIGGSANVTLSTAQDSTPLSGILIYDDRCAPYNQQNGNNLGGGTGQILSGTLYFPTTAVAYTGGSSGGLVTSTCTQIVAATLNVSGGSGFSDKKCTDITAVINDNAPQLAE